MLSKSFNSHADYKNDFRLLLVLYIVLFVYSCLSDPFEVYFWLVCGMDLVLSYSKWISCCINVIYLQKSFFALGFEMLPLSQTKFPYMLGSISDIFILFH